MPLMLNEVATLAQSYAELALRDNKDEKPDAKAIICHAVEFNVLQMAHFCQQVVSHCPDNDKASAILTVFTNRLLAVIEELIDNEGS